MPEFVAAGIVRLGRLDGWLLVSVAGCFSVVSLGFGDAPGAVGGALAVVAGFLELRGASLVAAGKGEGLRFLVFGQALLLGAILGYCFWRLNWPDYGRMEKAMPPFVGAMAESSGLSLRELLRMVYPLVYTTLALVSVCYQGGMMLHYLRARPALGALTQERRKSN